MGERTPDEWVPGTIAIVLTREVLRKTCGLFSSPPPGLSLAVSQMIPLFGSYAKTRMHELKRSVYSKKNGSALEVSNPAEMAACG